MRALVKRLNRTQKFWAFLTLDVVLVPLALLFTFLVQSSTGSPWAQFFQSVPALPYIMAIAGAMSYHTGLPFLQLNAYGTHAFSKTLRVAAVTGAVVVGAALLAAWPLALGTAAVFTITYVLMCVMARMVLLQIVLAIYRRGAGRVSVLIYGAGGTGTQVAQALLAHDTIDPIAFIDDNATLHGRTVTGLRVYPPTAVAKLVAENHITRAILAIPSLNRPKQMQIARKLEKLGLEVEALPSFAQLIGEEPLIDTLTPVSDLRILQRAPLSQSLQGGAEVYAGKVVLISGAGGTIGSELCRQVLAYGPAKVLLYELSELALYTVDHDLRSLVDPLATEIVPILGTLTDPRQVRQVFTEHAPQVVLHAAAYKHVPLVEQNPNSGLANNVLGAHTLAKASGEFGVERFVLISSDKAVRPTNIMGASKRLAELVIQDLASRSQCTVFAIVRFGNVLDSSGSVIPLFRDQIARGGPVTVTHPEVTRYFMTVEEAAGLVLLSGSFAIGGEVFVLDMGKPIKIMDLARQVIEAAGYSVRDQENPEGDIEIELIGLRPGEKMYEELLTKEGDICTQHKKIFVAHEERLSEFEINAALRALRQAIASGDPAAARAVAETWVKDYAPQQKTHASAFEANQK
jgi:FlaA1/EpsC-like NDP-sugar epimerase